MTVCAGTGYTLCPDLATSGRTLTTWLETINQGGKRLILNGWKHYVCHCNSPGRENLEKNERCDREKKERKKRESACVSTRLTIGTSLFIGVPYTKGAVH